MFFVFKNKSGPGLDYLRENVQMQKILRGRNGFHGFGPKRFCEGDLWISSILDPEKQAFYPVDFFAVELDHSSLGVLIPTRGIWINRGGLKISIYARVYNI